MVESHKELSDIIEGSPAFSGVIAIRTNKDEPMFACEGLSHRPTATRNNPTTRFGIASGTKGFTAAAIHMLLNRGTVELDSHIMDLLPNLSPTISRSVTIRHLLTHTSGIPDYCDEELGCDFEAIWRDIPVYAVRRIDDFLPLFVREPMKFVPGARFSYSNSGFLVLGLILELFAKTPYADHIQQALFSRLGMHESGFFMSDSLPPNSAIGYIAEEDGSYRSNVFAIPIIGAPDGGVYTSAADMMKFWDGLFSGELVGPQSIEAIRSTSIGPTGEGDLTYSLGFWRANTWGDDVFFVLLGSDPGVSFFSAYEPESGDCFVILSNTDTGAWKCLEPVRKFFMKQRARIA